MVRATARRQTEWDEAAGHDLSRRYDSEFHLRRVPRCGLRGDWFVRTARATTAGRAPLWTGQRAMLSGQIPPKNIQGGVTSG